MSVTRCGEFHHRGMASMNTLEHGCGTVQRGGEYGNLLAGAVQVALVDCFVDSRNYYSRVAGVDPRGVNGMAEPGAVGKTFGYEQRALGLSQGKV